MRPPFTLQFSLSLSLILRNEFVHFTISYCFIYTSIMIYVDAYVSLQFIILTNLLSTTILSANISSSF